MKFCDLSLANCNNMIHVTIPAFLKRSGNYDECFIVWAPSLYLFRIYDFGDLLQSSRTSDFFTPEAPYKSDQKCQM